VLSAPVEIVRDQDGVAHIYASTDADGLFASGYAQATDRLFQMDLMRRRALGRTAEVLGEDRVSDDVLVRTVGIPRWGLENAEASKTQGDDTYALVSAWTAGINRRIQEVQAGDAPMPLGFQTLGYAPEPWDPSDGYTVGKLIEFGNSNQLEFDLLATLISSYRPDAFAAIPFYAPISETFITPLAGGSAAAEPPSGPSFLVPQAPADASARLSRFLGAMSRFHPGASNNWAVAPENTDTGRSLIAGDPHQGLKSPSVMWLQHIKTTGGDGTLDVVGWSFVGTPGVSLGHNAHVAWTATTNYPDVTDLWDVQKSETGIVLGGEELPIAARQETIAVAGAEPVVVTIEEVPGHGVLLPADLSPLPVGDVGNRLLLNWTGFQRTREADAFLAFDRAKSLDELAAAVDDLERGNFNWVFATADGIRYHSSPRVPDRGDPATAAPAYLVLDGAAPETRWTGALLDGARLPRSDGGDDGFIVTANNDPFGFTKGGSLSDDPYYFGAYFDPGTRAARIRQRLSETLAGGSVTLEDMQSIQRDTHSIIADEIVPELEAAWAAAATDPDLAEFAGRSDLQELVTLLSSWDRDMSRDQAAPLAFELVLFLYAHAAIADDLGIFFDPVLGSSPTYIVKIALLATRDPLGALLQEGKNRLFLQAMSDASAVLTERWGAVASGYTWADFHASAFRSESIDALDGGIVSTDGGEGTVNVSEASPLDGAAVGERHLSHDGSVYRMAATFDEDGTPRAYFNMARGTSGEPEAPHWNDLTPNWVDGEYRLLRFADADVQAARAETIQLAP
jgi:penicillin amidase